MIRAALIDLDGFLINSEELYLAANKIYFKGFNFTEKMHRDGTGKKFEVWIKSVFPSDKSGEEILRERNEIYYNLAQKKLKLLPRAKEFLEKVKKILKTSLVTSSKRKYVDFVFNITQINGYFDFVVTGEMVSRGKPDPECYFLAAKQLNVLPRECIVFEDAPNGVAAGKAAGMRVVAVPSKYVKGDPNFKKADFVYENLGELVRDSKRWLA